MSAALLALLLERLEVGREARLSELFPEKIDRMMARRVAEADARFEYQKGGPGPKNPAMVRRLA